jgi:hypothetical protein
MPKRLAFFLTLKVVNCCSFQLYNYDSCCDFVKHLGLCKRSLRDAFMNILVRE